MNIQLGVKLLLTMLLISINSGNSVAHDANTFTVVIKADQITPLNPHIVVNDTVMWLNADNSSENVTHVIYLDFDMDGDYYGEDDYKSNNLSRTCEYDNNGTKIDDDCYTADTFTFNETTTGVNYTKLNGTYPYLDLSSDGKKIFGNISVNPDMQHLKAGFQGDTIEESVETDDKEKRPTFLLIIAGISGISAIGLATTIFLGKKDDVE